MIDIGKAFLYISPPKVNHRWTIFRNFPTSRDIPQETGYTFYNLSHRKSVRRVATLKRCHPFNDQISSVSAVEIEVLFDIWSGTEHIRGTRLPKSVKEGKYEVFLIGVDCLIHTYNITGLCWFVKGLLIDN